MLAEAVGVVSRGDTVHRQRDEQVLCNREVQEPVVQQDPVGCDLEVKAGGHARLPGAAPRDNLADPIGEEQRFAAEEDNAALLGDRRAANSTAAAATSSVMSRGASVSGRA